MKHGCVAAQSGEMMQGRGGIGPPDTALLRHCLQQLTHTTGRRVVCLKVKMSLGISYTASE